MLSRRRRRPTYGRRKKKKGGPPTSVILGLAGVVGLGFVIKTQVSDDEAPALSTTPMTAEAPAEPGTGAADSAATARNKGPVPGQLSAALGRTTADAEALCDLRTIVVDYPDSPQAQKARAMLAQARTRGLQVGRAPAQSHADHVRRLAGLTQAYLATLEPQARRSLRNEAEEASAKVFRSGDATSGKLLTAYTVRPGDVLGAIARRHKTSYRLIKRLNGMQSDRIRIGQKLRIPRGKVRVLVLKRDFELVCLLGGLFVKSFDVATGKNGKTPIGRFTIGTKLVNPDWYAPDGKVYKFGTKENILGTRWLAWNHNEHQGFGIHGTAFPESIGTEASMGCIRMRNHEVEELYDLVPPNSKVRVLP